MNQGYPLSPTIFNHFVGTVVRNWVSLVAGDAGGQDRLGRDVHPHAALLYMEYGFFAFTDPEWMQEAFDTLTGLFKRVGLRTNASKTVGMIYCP